jgi:hypothetical protein
VFAATACSNRNVRARAILRRPFPGANGGAALEERYARELVDSLGGEPERGPRFVFGASGLILSGLAAGWEECLEWEIGEAAHPPGYAPDLVEEVIAAVRTDLDAFGEAEQPCWRTTATCWPTRRCGSADSPRPAGSSPTRRSRPIRAG